MRDEPVDFSGVIVSVQPHVRMTRSFDQREETYLGYIVMLRGVVDAEPQEFSLSVDESTQRNHDFKVGDAVGGKCVTVGGRELVAAGFEHPSDLKIIQQDQPPFALPPWSDEPPDLAVYRKRGFRRLNQRTYEAQCIECIWGCHMAVEEDRVDEEATRHRGPDEYCAIETANRRNILARGAPHRSPTRKRAQPTSPIAQNATSAWAFAVS